MRYLIPRLSILGFALEELIGLLAFLATGSEDTVIISVVKCSHKKALLVLDCKQTVLCVVDVV